MSVEICGAITISKDQKEVFEFVSNLENDYLWRKEINCTKMSSNPRLNAMATEDSYLSKRVPHFLMDLICTEYTDHCKIIYQTVPHANFFLRSIREVRAASQKSTTVIYLLTFDKNIVKHGLGFSLPIFVIRMAAKRNLKRYLCKLKEVLERR
jgi:hypothetical protein